MDRSDEYLCLSEAYARFLGGLRWSPVCDAIDLADGSTYAFSFQIGAFLEGYLAHGSLIHFGYVLHLLGIVGRREERSDSGVRGIVQRAFRKGGRSHRNAGAFFAAICTDVPSVPGPPVSADLLWRLQYPPHQPPALDPRHRDAAEAPPKPPEWFDSHILNILESYGVDDLLHWFRHGTGTLKNVAPLVRQAVARPLSLSSVLAELSHSPRLVGAMPYVGRFVGALSLPRRKLERNELPMGGYDDITIRGDPAQLLPGQLALDPDEFVRRFAERELLFFRREEPLARRREELIVLLDQGVRTWGAPRLMLAAATLALARYSERRRLIFRVAATSGAITLNPLEVEPAEIAALLEASDLSRHPGRALERVLEENAAAACDVLLLTHPRNLTEPDVAAAARRQPPGVRLFALSVTAAGEAELSEIRHGAPLSLSRFRVEPDATGPALVAGATAAARPWEGDVETVPYPFCFGAASTPGKLLLAFDHSGKWLLLALAKGMLHATRTDGSGAEMWPRARSGNGVLTKVDEVIGVAGGFVVVGMLASQLGIAHYDIPSRTSRLYVTDFAAGKKVRGASWYVRRSHTVVMERGDLHWCLDLSTGQGEFASVLGPASVPRRLGALRLHPLRCPREVQPPRAIPSREVQSAGASVPEPEDELAWPMLAFNPLEGEVKVRNVPNWQSFKPQSDGQPLLIGSIVTDAECRGPTLAAAFVDTPGPRSSQTLRIFRGPEGVPVAHYPMKGDAFALSNDGRLLGLQAEIARVEVRDALVSGPAIFFTPVGRFHPTVDVRLGSAHLHIDNGAYFHVVRWSDEHLVCESARAPVREPDDGVMATRMPLPVWLSADDRFVKCARGWLVVVVDSFGQVALFEHDGRLICMFFTFRNRLAAWMPDGTSFGPEALLGRPAEPGAADRIGSALMAAWNRAQRRNLA